MNANEWPVKPCAVITMLKQETLISIGFTGMLAADVAILSQVQLVHQSQFLILLWLSLHERLSILLR